MNLRDRVLRESAGGIVTINLDALASNYIALAAAAAPARCAAVVKADAYGLGVVPVARTLSAAGCLDFFVAHLVEAVDLRACLPAAAVYVLNGVPPGCERACVEAGCVPVLNTLEDCERWARFGRMLDRRNGVVLQFDTGMSRLGLSTANVDHLIDHPAILDALDVVMVISHLACADEPDRVSNRRQAERFLSLSRRFPGVPASLANSAGLLGAATLRFDVVRPGIALYGAAPFPGVGVRLRPVVRLQARVLQIREVGPGTAVGYGEDFVVGEAGARIATVGVGYADGWPRRMSALGAAYHRGIRLPIAGRVSMDSLSLDISAVAKGVLRTGSLVDLIGPDQPLETVAEQCGTIPYEILTSLGARYARRYVGGDKADVGALR